MLMDEPFSAVDPVVRDQLQDEFLRLQGELGKTIVFVTHDIDEAVKLGDQVAVMRVGGRLAQLADPARAARRPRGRLRRRLRRPRPRLPRRSASAARATCRSASEPTIGARRRPGRAPTAAGCSSSTTTAAAGLGRRRPPIGPRRRCRAAAPRRHRGRREGRCGRARRRAVLAERSRGHRRRRGPRAALSARPAAA